MHFRNSSYGVARVVLSPRTLQFCSQSPPQVCLYPAAWVNSVTTQTTPEISASVGIWSTDMPCKDCHLFRLPLPWLPWILETSCFIDSSLFSELLQHSPLPNSVTATTVGSAFTPYIILTIRLHADQVQNVSWPGIFLDISRWFRETVLPIFLFVHFSPTDTT
jgi:hypothetical protein